MQNLRPVRQDDRLHLTIDWGMDGHGVGNGQFRYATDLLTALSQLNAIGPVTVFGVGATPPERVRDLFLSNNEWSWLSKPIATHRGADFVNQWRSFWAHRRHRMDILHVIDSTVPLYAPCPVVTTAYDLMAEIFAGEYHEWLASRGYRRFRWLNQRRVNRIIAISHTTSADYQRLWRIPSSKIDVVHLASAGFPPCGFHQSWKVTLFTRFPELSNRRFVLTPYNLEPRKNLCGVLKAFACLRHRFPDLLLVLFGQAAWSAQREAAANAQIAALGIGPAIRHTGFVNDTELAVLYRAADVFVFPSLYEGFGLPVLEAMACGGCVLAKPRSAMAEVVGGAGIMIDTSNVELLASEISDLISSPTRREQLRAAALVRAATFTVERMARETAAVYYRTAGRPSDVLNSPW